MRLFRFRPSGVTTVITVLYLLLVTASVIYIQELRKVEWRAAYGWLPSLLAATGFPLIFTVMRMYPNGTRIARMALLYVFTLGWHIVYELVLYLDGRTFDHIDNLAAAIGAVIGVAVYELINYREFSRLALKLAAVPEE
ncbi:hypothetical protein [Neolewinella maritima]|uniref:hypothetical protein n=1 Tax=Neolewinella maritima TaxID=1383882 RepID=UPI001EE8C17D|nr:hypothetical protein [Neolewinella maritima]